MNSPRPLAERFQRRHFSKEAFTMVELLVVMAIFVIMAALVTLAMTGKKQSDSLTRATYDIVGALQIARTYATANNTYVWVGFFEEDISKGGGAPGTGRIVISTVASKNGTSIYNREIAMAASSAQMLAGTNLIQIGKLQKIDNVHLMAVPSGGGYASEFASRPGGRIVSGVDRIGSPNSTSLFYFQYPLLSPPQYTFAGQMASGGGTGIVQFNPRGEAITDGGPVPGVAPCKEIAIQATHGTTPDASPNIVAIDIAGMTGVITIYRR